MFNTFDDDKPKMKNNFGNHFLMRNQSDVKIGIEMLNSF